MEGVEGMSLSPEGGVVITLGGGDKQVLEAEEERERVRMRVIRLEREREGKERKQGKTRSHVSIRKRW